ncbi:NAD(P)-dependent dehydrogenase (short-subunit alcohol dehydrogenase family) [Bradyrhizobium japonicum]|uniref:NAD(P)-dependent dehydrogenase (Short-subunit alcohol dehydrogenase family) n=1 Tax=Bradyrhizobium elkanii TaxID=29448 RepID=A0ABV4F7U4_BRAEL|nr:SDR family oxidoreductase [Bradyrhizobium elkanii]MBP2433591.1 NAD(P)-dependent dehydrogenase (short-subunit alcohol dehydrogenase family) [Bradyrhizobium elkanii]MCP1733021.1 NAD(P)-dependent dehydrogenase (short-subunit alcohol dehydrogenase family) [Bradyrhizobium elkanii]MCP1750603.1 NAD(P)-dependent dehydrogenase (short-subunit alcohol dehydrogenase family) [Bradyrhizobium elkanii]MCP1976377.1 NAD(P)-dependent dehydrogenase (short-subunit alcohol dehydrogenase family) [Bradyrhizobium el
MTAPAKTVLVSGGTFGIGRAITLGLARRGHAVVAFGLEAAQVSSTAQNAIPALREQLDREGLSAELMEADVSQANDVARVVAHAMARFGRIDGVVNNAAIGPLGTVLDTDEALFDRIIAVNLKGPYLTSRAAIPYMIAQGGGSIVNIGSGAGWGKPNMAVYSASKGGVVALSAAMAYDFFHQRIRVNTVIPGGGGIVSGMSLGRVGGDAARFGKGAPGTAAGRVAAGDDIANVVAFLLSPEAETLSGTVIDVGCFAQQGGPIPPQPAL